MLCVFLSFQAEADSDLSLVEGEVVTILSQTDRNWALVCSRTSGRSGHCPLNHLNLHLQVS